MQKKFTHFRVTHSIGKLSIFYLTFSLLFSLSTLANANAYESPSTDLQDNMIVSGVVTDEMGEPLPGVSILIKGTTKGTITSFDGSYKLSVQPKDVLVYSFIGYLNHEEVVGIQTVLDVKMNLDEELLDEVVVVGYGVQKKQSIVGAIETTPTKELLESGGATNMTSALTGRVAGMTVIESSGEPGQNEAQILIRGRSSWNDNSPLVLVDGVERSFNDIDPNEVESISVLKDASATAVFGVKGANGVILVTSKQGSEEKTRINISQEVGMKTPMNTSSRLDMPSTFRLANQALANDGLWDQMIPESYIRNWENPNRDMEKYPEVDWWDEVVGTGYQSKTNFNISGGTKKIKYFTSVGYLKETDILKSNPQQDYDPSFSNDRLNFRTNLKFNVTKTTSVDFGISGNQKRYSSPAEVRTSNYQKEEFFKKIYRTPSYLYPVRFEDGSYGGIDPNGGDNPMSILNESGSGQTRRSELFTNLQLDQKLDFITKGLTFRAKVAFDTYTQFNKTISKDRVMFHYPTPESENRVRYPDANFVEQPVTINNWDYGWFRKTMLYEFSTRYNRTFGDHSVTGLLLFSRRINSPEVSFPFYEENWAGRVTYDYKMKYLAEVNVGVNGSDNFAPGQRFGVFPSFALGWVISEENIFRNADWLNSAKVRYSYGTVGRSHINNNTRHLYFGQYYQDGNINWRLGQDPTNWAPHYFEGRIPNESATWEKAVKQNLGFEATVFKNWRFTLDLFDEYRYDILMERRNIPAWSGFPENPYANIGEVKSRGFEVTLSYDFNIGEHLQIGIAPNFSVNESRIINRDDPHLLPDSQKDAGKPIGWKKGYVTDGLYKDWDDIYNSPNTNLGGNPIPGDIKYIDFNGDGSVDINDQTALKGLDVPTKTYGLNLSLNYKGFTVSALFYGVNGNYANISDDMMWGFAKGFYVLDEVHTNTWNPYTRDANANPTLHFQNMQHNNNSTEYRWQNASYWRLKNLEMGYNIKGKKSDFYRNIYVYASGNNLFTFTSFDSRLDPANSNAAYPLVRRFNLGLRFGL
ncbi:TonB-dependent receptor [Flammeovirga sp. MY04]|uniref:SusC/RagA family TonB-linked outer membrane protein n=1 Tax=Flammeovirga sp. MY04 TaxID=1191459 RepID=UPI00080641F8|nr:TonB-dependent receptor [Flammeovirga sp. MY04]ANQ51409.1 TonB-dependent receptor [Flammeovirga sp. MY04]